MFYIEASSQTLGLHYVRVEPLFSSNNEGENAEERTPYRGGETVYFILSEPELQEKPRRTDRHYI